MSLFKQTNRYLRIDTPLEQASLVLAKISGTETLGQLFHYDLSLYSDKMVAASDLLNQTVLVTLDANQKEPHCIHGIVQQFGLVHTDMRGAKEYHAVLVPQFMRLNYRRNCRIFENKSVIDIFKTLCQEHGVQHTDISRLIQTYLPQDYKVQYNETDLEFLQRTLAYAGIFYYFSHAQDKHVLTLVDDITQLPHYQAQPVIYRNVQHQKEHLSKWQPQFILYPQTVASKDFDFKTPQVDLSAKTTAQPLIDALKQHALGAYHYPGNYQTQAQGEIIVKRKQKAALWRAHCIHAMGNILDLHAGQQFKLNEHEDPQQRGPYYIYQATQTAMDLTHVQSALAPDELAQSYNNELICIATDFPFAPLLPDLPQTGGIQSAQVIGPKGQSIYTDDYARVKVQFHWERSKQASCWLRVAQMWAGNTWGSQWIPRVGEEVLVSFLNGNVDHPVVVGSVYNGLNQPPFHLPKQQAISGLRSPTIDSQDPYAYQQLWMNDTPEKEQLGLIANRDFVTTVKHNHHHHVKGDEKVAVLGNHVLQVLQDQATINAQTITFAVGTNQLKIDANGVSFAGKKVEVLTQGAGSKKPVARVGDPHQCPKLSGKQPHHGGPVLKGSPNVLINGLPAARQGDPAHCKSGKDKIKSGVSSVLVNGQPLARLNAKMQHGGVIHQGSPNVFVGEYEPPSVVLPTLSAKQTQLCMFAELTLQCGHTTRTFHLDAQKGKPTRAKAYILQVIASDTTPDRVRVRFQGQCHNSVSHTNLCPGIEVVTPTQTLYAKSSTLVDVYASKNVHVQQDFRGFFQQILLPNSDPTDYQIIPVSCTSIDAHPVTIEAFAPLQWHGEVSLSYGHDTQKDSNFNQNQGYKKLKVHAQWKLAGKISVKRNNESWTLGASQEKQGGHYKKNPISRQLFKGVQGFLDKIVPHIGGIKSDMGSITIDWPKLTLSGGVYNQEVADSYLVDTAGEIKIGMGPLFGVHANADVLNWLIAVATDGLGVFLLKVKKDLADGVGDEDVGASAQLKVIFSAGMTIKGNTHWKKSIGSDWEANGLITGEIPLTLKGKAEIDAHFFSLFAAAGADINIASTVSSTFEPCVVEGKPAVNTQFIFGGLTVYWTIYRKVMTKSHKHCGTRQWASSNRTSEKISLKKYTNKSKVIQSVCWPEKPITILLNEGEL